MRLFGKPVEVSSNVRDYLGSGSSSRSRLTSETRGIVVDDQRVTVRASRANVMSRLEMV